MSVFPPDIITELFINGGWRRRTDRLTRDDVVITRGQRDESGRAEFSTAGLTFDNRSGDYSPRNPTGAFWGSLGRNTPIRISLGVDTDPLTGTTVNGWGSTTGARPWSTSGGVAGDYQRTAAGATHSISTANANRLTYLPAVTYLDVEVAVTVAIPFVNILGGQVEPGNIVLRGQSVTDYYYAQLAITPTETITLAFLHADGTVIAAPITAAISPFPALGELLRVRAHTEGQTLRAKVWPATADEPYGWDLTAHTERITTAGWVGVRSGVATGNTNTTPIAFTYTNFEVRHPRLPGEIAEWPPAGDLSDSDVSTPVVAGGILRRLRQGSGLASSAIYRAVMKDSPATLVAYWPAEDDISATSISTPVAGAAPMALSGSPTFAAYSGIVASAPLPTVGASSWTGDIPAYTDGANPAINLRHLIHVPSGGLPNGTIISALLISGGSSDLCWIRYATGGALSYELYKDGAFQINVGPISNAAPSGADIVVMLDLRKSGIDVFTRLLVLPVGSDATSMSSVSITRTNATLGTATKVVIGPYKDLAATAIGHISVRSTFGDLTPVITSFSANAGETAGTRMQRLCSEAGIPFSYLGDLTATVAMGPQAAAPDMDLIDDCVDADRGVLFESRGEHGLSYRARASRYNQPATMTLSYSGGQVGPGFQVTDDDRFTHNDVTVKRRDGSSARSVQTTGPMSVADPAHGGVGRYPRSPVTLAVYTDSQLADLAGWVRHLGTVNESRYPLIEINLANPQVSADAALSAAALDLNIDDRLLITEPPLTLTPNTISQLARGYTERINADVHTIEINGVPQSPYQVLQLDTGTARLPPDSSSINTGIDSVQPTALVDATPPWTTDPTQMPIAVDIDGELVSVTGITGTSSPQTFTMLRSRNRVVKAHAAGAPVTVANPVVIPL